MAKVKVYTNEKFIDDIEIYGDIETLYFKINYKQNTPIKYNLLELVN